MLSSNCGIQRSKGGDFSKSPSAESPERMSSVNDGKPAFKRSESYGRRAKTLIAVSAMFALSMTGTLSAQAAEQAELSSGAKPVQAEILDFAGRFAEVVKKSIGAKCDQLAGDPEDPQKSGVGVSGEQLDSAAAIEACKQAVEVSPLARYQYQLGRALDKAEKYTEALDWYRKAADQEYAFAQNSLGGMNERGLGFLQRDYAEAMKWYRKAADQGDARGQHSVGLMYRDLKGVSQDNGEASKWFRLAAAQGHRGAKHALEELDKEELQKWDSYQTVEARLVEAHKLDYIGKKVNMDFKNIGDVAIETSQGQLTLTLQKIRLFGELMRLSTLPGNATSRRELLG